MNQIERIQRMEQNLDIVAEAVRSLSDALEAYSAIQPQLQELIHYYESPQWLADYDADAAGLIPADVKRGVLSQDAVYNLLTEHNKLLTAMKEITCHERDF